MIDWSMIDKLGAATEGAGPLRERAEEPGVVRVVSSSFFLYGGQAKRKGYRG